MNFILKYFKQTERVETITYTKYIWIQMSFTFAREQIFAIYYSILPTLPCADILW